MTGPSKAQQFAPHVAELHAQGLGRNAIARTLGCSAGTVTAAARHAGVVFDGRSTADATEVVRRSSEQRRADIVTAAADLADMAATKLLAALARDELEARELVRLFGVAADKFVKLAPEPDHDADQREEAKEALDELMSAIRGSVVDLGDVAAASVAPGASMVSVLGPDGGAA